MNAINPFILAGFAISIGSLIYGANRLSPWLTVGIFASSCIGAIAVALWSRSKPFSKPSNKVDHAKLNQINLVPYSSWIKENLRGHDEIVDSIISSIQEELTLARPGKILGAYLLVGPTGTGKTFLSQLVAQALYPDSDPIILRMNQLKHADDVFTLIGPPPGRAGYEIGGSLTRPVLENPYRVIIFDEIEKCHPDLRHCLYDILDTAQCREKSSGKLVDFSGCAFFGTCNAGVDPLRSVINRTPDLNQRAAQSRDVLAEAGGFDKAFLARWSRIDLMDELEPIHIAEVALLQLCKYWKDYGMEITYVPPRLLLEAVERNEEFRSYGVRQLATFIRSKTTQAINQARAAKKTRVKLDVSPSGELMVRPEI
jgi:ATP-dependent Clp protease ATP-binding subunit ClpC